MPTSVDVLETTLQSWAEHRAQESGTTVEKAFDEMVRTEPLAREFYADLRAARRDPSIMAKRYEEIRKTAPVEKPAAWASDAERKLDELAERHAEKRSISKAAAYDEVLRTEKGRELYRRHRATRPVIRRSEEHTSELQSPCNLVCRLLLEKKKNNLTHQMQ